MNKKTKKIAIVVIVATISLCLIILLLMNTEIKKVEDTNTEKEIVPEEEISDAQIRETRLNLFYIGENNELVSETKKIDSKELIENPYIITIKMLLNNPSSSNLKTYIPQNTKINSIKKNGECIEIDLSNEFIDDMEENVEVQGLAISQIVNTMTQFSEINKVKIYINGSDEVTFKNGNINFKQLFTNED